MKPLHDTLIGLRNIYRLTDVLLGLIDNQKTLIEERNKEFQAENDGHSEIHCNVMENSLDALSMSIIYNTLNLEEIEDLWANEDDSYCVQHLDKFYG